MTTFVDEVSRTPLWQTWRIELLATHRSGSISVRAAAFAQGLAGFLLRVLRGQLDLVHLHTSHYGSFPRKAILLWLAAGARLPVVLQVHAGEFPVFYRRMPRPVRWFIRRTLTRANVVVALGGRCARELQAIAPSARVVSIPNGVRMPMPRPSSRPDGPVRVVFLGQMSEMKGTFTLLEAWASLVADVPDLPAVHLVCAGDGDVAGVRTTVARLGLSGTVEVRPWMPRSDVAALLASADILTLPSRFEGQPMAVLEAMANGLCVVASAVGGIPDLIEDGQSGLLVPPDSVERLSEALRTVIIDRGLRVELGSAAQNRARDLFDVEVVWRRFDLLYRELLDDPRSSQDRSTRRGADMIHRARATGPLRVLFVVPSLKPGGAERHVATLLPALDPARFTPGVVCIGQAGALFRQVADAGIQARALNRSKHGSGKTLADLVLHMRQFRPDVVVMHGNNAEILGRIAAVLTRVPRSVVWVHQATDLDLVPRGVLRRCIEAALRPLTAAYFGVAFGQIAYLTETLGHPARKIRIIQNGVDPDRFPYVPNQPRDTPLASSLGIGAGDLIVGIIAVMRPEKDHATFLRASRLVLDQVPDARFLLIGDGPLRDDVLRQAEEIGVAHRVIFAGMREDVSDLLALIDVFVLSSTSECFPMSVLEAMATGRPTVCTAVGGVPEIVDDGVTGYLVPPSDPAALAERLVSLLQDSVQRRAMGKAGRARVESELNLDRSVNEAQRRLEEIAGRVSKGFQEVTDEEIERGSGRPDSTELGSR